MDTSYFTKCVYVTCEFGHTWLIKWFLSVIPFEHSSVEVKIVYSLLNAGRTYLKMYINKRQFHINILPLMRVCYWTVFQREGDLKKKKPLITILKEILNIL